MGGSAAGDDDDEMGFAFPFGDDNEAVLGAFIKQLEHAPSLSMFTSGSHTTERVPSSATFSSSADMSRPVRQVNVQDLLAEARLLQQLPWVKTEGDANASGRTTPSTSSR
jgi:hypothetical protein